MFAIEQVMKLRFNSIATTAAIDVKYRIVALQVDDSTLDRYKFVAIIKKIVARCGPITRTFGDDNNG
jgi:hypothetical protein